MTRKGQKNKIAVSVKYIKIEHIFNKIALSKEIEFKNSNIWNILLIVSFIAIRKKILYIIVLKLLILRNISIVITLQNKDSKEKIRTA